MSYLCRIIIMYTMYTFQKLHKRLTFLACEYLNYMYANVFWISAIVIVKHSNTNLKTVDYFDMFFFINDRRLNSLCLLRNVIINYLSNFYSKTHTHISYDLWDNDSNEFSYFVLLLHYHT